MCTQVIMKPSISSTTEYRPVARTRTTPVLMMQDVAVSRPAIVMDDHYLQKPYFKLEKVFIEKEVPQQVRLPMECAWPT